MRIVKQVTILAGTAAALALAIPAYADVKTGVDAWAKGDYAAAIAQWEGPAARGDADAQFNMAQAYRLGRGVPADPARAEALYAKAAAQGHLKAADNYGLLLFQKGERAQAMPYIQGAADRGDPRAQYLLGIAHFNGDLVAKDWTRAYALLTLANAAELPQARTAIAQMDEYIPLPQRQEAQVLARSLRERSDATRASQMAAVDLNDGVVPVTRPARIPVVTAAPPPRPARPARPAPPPIQAEEVLPSVAAARAAVEEARRATGTDSPATAGADYARRAEVATAAPTPRATPSPKPTTTPVRDIPATAPEPATTGPWRVQLGAFGVAGNADRLWSRLSGNAALSGKSKLLVRSGNLTKLQAGGFPTRRAAQSACDRLKRAGQPCLVTK